MLAEKSTLFQKWVTGVSSCTKLKEKWCFLSQRALTVLPCSLGGTTLLTCPTTSPSLHWSWQVKRRPSSFKLWVAQRSFMACFSQELASQQLRAPVCALGWGVWRWLRVLYTINYYALHFTKWHLAKSGCTLNIVECLHIKYCWVNESLYSYYWIQVTFELSIKRQSRGESEPGRHCWGAAVQCCLTGIWVWTHQASVQFGKS